MPTLPDLEPRPARDITKIGTLLVVDDSPRNLQAIGLVLDNFLVVAFSDAQAAIAYFEQHRQDFDAVILDVKMPHPSGEVVFHELRKLDERIPIIFHTAMPGTYQLFDHLAQLSGYCVTKGEDLDAFRNLVVEVVLAHGRVGP